MNYGVALNIRHAQTMIRQRLQADAILSFCPATTQALEEHGYKVIPAVHHYRALSHARAAVLVARDLEALKPQLQGFYRLSEGEARNLSVYLFHFLCIAYYLYFATRSYRRPGNAFFWVGPEGIRRGDYLAMYLDLAEQGKVKITSYAHTDFSHAHYLLAAGFNRALAAVIRRRRGVKVMDFGDELPKKIIGAMLDGGEAVTVIASRKMSKNLYKCCYFFVKSLRRALAEPKKGKPVMVFRAAPPARYKTKADAPGIALEYEAVTRAAQAAIQSYIPFLKAEYEIGHMLADMFHPDIGISDYAKYPYVLAAQERLHACGGRYVMMNHGTHTAQYSPVSRIAAGLWAAQDRLITPFVTDHVPKSPLTHEIARTLRPEGGFTLHKLNLFQDIKTHPGPGDEFMILHAGNFMDVYYHIPWCKETSEEYLLAIYELLEEMRGVEGAKLVIKLKAKKAAAHLKLVQEHIDKLQLSGKAVIDTSTRFSELLAKTSLVVSNLSGTVEEALINHIPVMIHTYHKRYFHIPEEVLAPSGLNPAYLVKERADIRKIIAFAQANRDALFAPELYGKVAWRREEQANLRDFARELASLSGKSRYN